MYKINLIDKITFIIVILGAINYGLYGLFNLDIVKLIFGDPINIIGRIIYILIGVAGLNIILVLFKMSNINIDKD